MVDICAMEPLESLTPAQRKAALVFWYQAEVSNGGHFQYFTNSAGVNRLEALQALRDIGAKKAADVLSLAILTVAGSEHSRPSSLEEYVEQEVDCDLRELDAEYYKAANAEIQAALLHYLRANESQFVFWVAQ